MQDERTASASPSLRLQGEVLTSSRLARFTPGGTAFFPVETQPLAHGMRIPGQAAATKIMLPRHPRIHPRQRLFQRLDAALGNGVVWVQGPPGAGKTMLVSRWLEAGPRNPTWLSLDVDDGDEATLFHYLGLALRRTVPGAQVPAYPPHRPADPGSFARRFFRALWAAIPQGVLVLDDYHELPEESEVHSAVAVGLAERAPESAAIIISRAEPPASWARLRSHGRLTWLRPEELLVSREDARAITALRSPGQDDQTCDSLYERSGGWMAGLIMLLEEGAFHASGHELVFSYLAEEVWGRLDAETRAVLLATFLVPDFTDTIAVALSGTPLAPEILARFARRGYFIAYLDGSCTYRFHSLFREFLGKQATLAWGDEELRNRQRAAAVVMAGSQRFDAALAMAGRAQAWDILESLLNEHAQRLFHEGRHCIVLSLTASVPADALKALPWLLYWRGCARRVEERGQALADLTTAFDVFRSRQEVIGAALSWAAYAMGYLWDVEHVPEGWFARLQEFEHDPELATRHDLEACVAEAVLTNAMVCHSPRHPVFRRWEERALRIALSSSKLEARFPAACQLHFTYGFWGTNLPRARVLESATELRHDCEVVDPGGRILWLLAEAHLCVLSGTPSRAIEVVARALQLSRATSHTRWDSLLQCVRGLALLRLGELAKAGEVIQSVDRSGASPRIGAAAAALRHYVAAVHAFLLGDLPRARAEAASAVRVADTLAFSLVQAWMRTGLAQSVSEALREETLADALRWADDTGFVVGQHAAHLGLARHLQRVGRGAEAVDHLRLGLAIGADAGIVGLDFWRASDWSEPCTEALVLGIEVDYVRRLISTIGVPANDRAQQLEQWPWRLKVRLIDGVSLERPQALGTAPAKKHQKKLHELLALLVDAGRRGATAEHLADQLWPESDGDLAAQSFHTTLHRLRRLLDVPNAVVHREGRFLLNPEIVFVDAWAAELMLDEWERMQEGFSPVTSQSARSASGARRLLDLVGPLLQRPQGCSSPILVRLAVRARRLLGKATSALQEQGGIGNR